MGEEIQNTDNKKRARDFSLSFMQVISALAVITMHTNGCFWLFSATERYWVTANIIECVFYFAVPVFFMITGITLLDYQDRYSTKEYFKKRAEKTVLPYIAWSLIGVVFLLATNRIPPETVTVKWVINGLLSTEGIIRVYWFFLPLFCVYLSIPLFAAVDKEKKMGIARYLLIAGFAVNILIPFLNTVFNLGIEWPYRIAVISDYIFWVWAGYYIYNDPPAGKQKTVIYILAAAGLLMHISGTYRLSVAAGSIQPAYKGYFNVPSVLYSIGVFVLLRDMAHRIEKIGWLKKAIETMAGYTFSVYLIHWFLLQIVEDLFAINILSIYYRLLMPFAAYAATMALVWCLRKIPVIKKIVP